MSGVRDSDEDIESLLDQYVGDGGHMYDGGCKFGYLISIGGAKQIPAAVFDNLTREHLIKEYQIYRYSILDTITVNKALHLLPENVREKLTKKDWIKPPYPLRFTALDHTAFRDQLHLVPIKILRDLSMTEWRNTMFLEIVEDKVRRAHLFKFIENKKYIPLPKGFFNPDIWEGQSWKLLRLWHEMPDIKKTPEARAQFNQCLLTLKMRKQKPTRRLAI